MLVKTKLKKLLLILFVAITSTASHAEKCDEFAPSFQVNGVEKWQGLTPIEVVKQENGAKAGDASNAGGETIMLKNLISPHATNGVLIISACGGDTKSFEVVDLLSAVSEKSDFSLTLSNRKFFKLESGASSRPLLKKVNRIKLVK